MLRAASRDRSASRVSTLRSSGKATRPSRRNSSVRGVGAATHRGDTGDGGQRGAPVLQRMRLVQVGDALLGDHVGDVVAVDHHRRQRHARLPADVDRVEGLHERGNSARPEGLGHLYHQLAAPPAGALAVREIQPGGRGVPPPVWIVAHVRGAAEAGQPAVGDGGGIGVARRSAARSR